MSDRHPNVITPWKQWSEDQTLYVACPYSNYFRWRTRRELLNNFRYHMQQSPNVNLFVGELAYGDRPHEVTTQDNPNDIQLRTSHELFHKENLGNVILSHISRSHPNWEYGALIDGDFHFTRHDWALEAIHQLQHYDFVQLFSSYVDLTGNILGSAQVPIRYNSGFFFNYIQNGYTVSQQYHNGPVKDEDGYEGAVLRGVGATGGAIAFRRSALEKVGGLLDRCILGHSDWYMAFQLAGVEPPDIHSQKYHPNYQHYVRTWGKRAESINRNIGYVDGHAIHYFHGSKTRRAYSSRDVILADNQYDPYTDIFPDSQGIYQLSQDKPRMRDAVRMYFVSRSEDDPNIYKPEKMLI